MTSVAVAVLQVGWVLLADGEPTRILGGLILFQFLLMLAYGCAIPNLLATALEAYGDRIAWVCDRSPTDAIAQHGA